MAVDFMIMPMSRDMSGDYITPAMRVAWNAGLPYTLITPQGAVKHPPGSPIGGAAAAPRRAAMLGMIREDLEALPPPIAADLWDEASSVEPRFHRPDSASYRALLEEALRRNGHPSYGGVMSERPAFHVATALYLPCDFDPVFAMSSPLQVATGSVKRALEELSSEDWPEGAQAAREVLLAALRDADELRLPLIVDA